MHFGNDSILGKAMGIIPSIKFELLKINKVYFDFQIGFGAAYLNKKYDKISNPLNNAIGSHWNNITQFAVAMERQVYKDCHITVGAHFTHFSNARTASPNAGINTTGLTFGIIQKLCEKLEGIRDGKMVNYKYFSDIGLPYPSIEEQAKIANFLSALDDKIKHVQHQIEKTEVWKRGLLQKMFC